MPRNNFNTPWGEDAPQFEKPDDSLIRRGWMGGAEQDPPDPRWENWWHNRVDSGMQQIERYGVMDYDSAAIYGIGGRARLGGKFYLSVATPNEGNNPSNDDGTYWIEDRAPGQNVMVFSRAGITEWTVPAVLRLGLRTASVHVIGAGGGGGKRSDRAAAGGGGGGIAEGMVDLSGVSSVPVTVGARGEGGSGSSRESGLRGGNSSFGRYMSATGGGGGSTETPGSGGIGSGGDINTSYGPGEGSAVTGSTAYAGGGGGPGGGGQNSDPVNMGLPGNPALGPGGGGGGSVGNFSGGPGYNGTVIVRW